MKREQLSCVFYGCIIGLLLGLWCGVKVEHNRVISSVELSDQSIGWRVRGNMPSLIDIQKAVGVKPDGIYGKETEKAWNEIVFNQTAKRLSERMKKEADK